LVQLVAENTIEILNREEIRAVSPGIFDQALDRSVERGSMVLHELLLRECRHPGEREYIEGFLRSEEQAPPEDAAVRRSLRRREIIDESGGQWRLAVPLMARWLRKNG
jgi:hypothetical protein